MHEIDLVWRLVLALVLSSVVGVEREMRQKSAGLRTHALVGLGAALFMLVSTYGFDDVLAPMSTSTRRVWPPRSSPGSASSAAA